jgi:hypothetical protein
MIEHPLPPSAESEIRALLQERRKIDAIKVLRQHTGIGLKEAKDRVEVMERDLGLPPAGLTESPSVLVVAVVIVGGLLAWWWLSR